MKKQMDRRLLFRRICFWAALVIFLFSLLTAANADSTDNEDKAQVQAAETYDFFDHFYGNEPFYLLYGWDPKNVKFQISFKYRLLNPYGSLTARWNWLSGFYFGYTQTSFLNFESDSNTIEDNSFMPEFLYYREDIFHNKISWISRFDFQTGIQHISNGQSGVDSRSLNILYVKPVFSFGNIQKYHFTVAPKVWAYVGGIFENPDIADYWGYFDLKMTFGKRDGLMLSTDLRKGTASGKGSIQFDFTYPLKIITFGNLNGYLQAQYFAGYGEELLFYNRKDTRFRVGIGFYR